MAPMATSGRALHQGHNLVDYHHIDSIAYFKALSDGLQKIFTMNHDSIVRFLCTQPGSASRSYKLLPRATEVDIYVYIFFQSIFSLPVCLMMFNCLQMLISSWFLSHQLVIGYILKFDDFSLRNTDSKRRAGGQFQDACTRLKQSKNQTF